MEKYPLLTRSNQICNTYIRKGRKYSVEEILPFLEKHKPPYKTKLADIDGDLININSSRMATFKTGTTCVCCGIEGAYFVKEKHARKPPKRFHLNLYAVVDGTEVLMTSDHIVPHCKRSGLHNNRQTMCCHCNQLKADREKQNEKQKIRKNNLENTKGKTLKEIVKDVEKEGVRCNCDLDNWQPETSTGHSWVCNIHKIAIERERDYG